MTKRRIKTPKDLENVKCLNCGSELTRFGDRSQINFKCTNKDCSSFFSDDALREAKNKEFVETVNNLLKEAKYEYYT